MGTWESRSQSSSMAPQPTTEYRMRPLAPPPSPPRAQIKRANREWEATGCLTVIGVEESPSLVARAGAEWRTQGEGGWMPPSLESRRCRHHKQEGSLEWRTAGESEASLMAAVRCKDKERAQCDGAKAILVRRRRGCQLGHWAKARRSSEKEVTVTPQPGGWVGGANVGFVGNWRGGKLGFLYWAYWAYWVWKVFRLIRLIEAHDQIDRTKFG